MDWLRRWYGILPSDLTSYQDRQGNEGWLIAWEHQVVGSVDAVLPAGEKLGRNGFRRISPELARSFGLPSPGRPAVFEPEPLPSEPDALAYPRSRTIPQVTKDEVWRRDGARCAICGATNGPWHIDHVFPFSKGGTNAPDNLQVLCAPCNLRKGATVGSDSPLVPLMKPLLEAARSVDLPVPATISDVQPIVRRLRESDPNQALALAWALDEHPDTPQELRDQVVELLATVENDEGQLFTLLHRSDNPVPELKRLAHSSIPAVAGRVAAEACLIINDDHEALRYARQAREQATNVSVQATAALGIGEYSDDDDEWRAELLFAYEHGSLLTRPALLSRSGSNWTTTRPRTPF